MTKQASSPGPSDHLRELRVFERERVRGHLLTVDDTRMAPLAQQFVCVCFSGCCIRTVSPMGRRRLFSLTHFRIELRNLLSAPSSQSRSKVIIVRPADLTIH